jgi:hypothetical protein
MRNDGFQQKDKMLPVKINYLDCVFRDELVNQDIPRLTLIVGLALALLAASDASGKYSQYDRHDPSLVYRCELVRGAVERYWCPGRQRLGSENCTHD